METTGTPAGKRTQGHRQGAPEDEHEEEEEELDEGSHDWVKQELDRLKNEDERMREAAEPIGTIEVEPGAVVDTALMTAHRSADQWVRPKIDSRLEAMDENDRIPESEHEWAEEAKVRVIDEVLGAEEAARIAGRGWIAVQRDQVEAIGRAIDETGVSSAQAIAIMMMIVGARIGERRMRDLVETMSEVTEVPTEAIRIGR